VARYLDVHPDNPQPRAIGAAGHLLRDGGLIAYPTDSCYALGCRLDNAAGLDRIRRIRDLDSSHHFTLVCGDLGQLGQFVRLDNAVFRAVKAAVPGQYTFILPATREVPKRMLHPRRRTVGVRVPAHPVTAALLAELGEPLVSSTLLLPGDEAPLTNGWAIKERLDHEIDAVLDSGDCGEVPTTVVDFSAGDPVVRRRGAGDPARFETAGDDVSPW
jgi:tRNA threonylcarbamoyl adenosine modification protein (Sua5/YciO/YrdC/YwlC family)